MEKFMSWTKDLFKEPKFTPFQSTFKSEKSGEDIYTVEQAQKDKKDIRTWLESSDLALKEQAMTKIYQLLQSTILSPLTDEEEILRLKDKKKLILQNLYCFVLKNISQTSEKI